MNTRNLISTALGALVFGCVANRPTGAGPSASNRGLSPALTAQASLVRTAGSGPAVVLLHGYAETSDSWLLSQLNWSRATWSLFLTFGYRKSSRPPGGYGHNQIPMRRVRC